MKHTVSLGFVDEYFLCEFCTLYTPNPEQLFTILISTRTPLTGRRITVGQRTMTGQNAELPNSYHAGHFDRSLSVKQQTNLHLN